MRDDIKEKGLLGEEVYDRATWRQAYIKVGIKSRKKKFADRIKKMWVSLPKKTTVNN